MLRVSLLPLPVLDVAGSTFFNTVPFRILSINAFLASLTGAKYDSKYHINEKKILLFWYYVHKMILTIDLPGIFVFVVVDGVVWAILKVGNVLIGGGGGGIGIFVACDC